MLTYRILTNWVATGQVDNGKVLKIVAGSSGLFEGFGIVVGGSRGS